MIIFMPVVPVTVMRNIRHFVIAVGNLIIFGMQYFNVAPKSNQIYPNLINFASNKFARGCGCICCITDNVAA